MLNVWFWHAQDSCLTVRCCNFIVVWKRDVFNMHVLCSMLITCAVVLPVYHLKEEDMAMGSNPGKPQQGHQIEINDLNDIDNLDATEDQKVLNRFLRIKAEEIIGVVGTQRASNSGFLSSATNGGDTDPIRV